MESNTTENKNSHNNTNASDTHFPAKRIKLKSPEGVVKSIRISDRTPIHAISDVIASRFKGRTPVGVEIDGDLITLDLLYTTATENGEYLVEFKKTAEQATLASAFKEHVPQAKDVIALPTPITELIPPIEPLGVFESCFPLKNGTPRQGILAPDSQGRLRIRPYRNTRPADVLEGIEQYSHVWIVFWFHGNFNKHCRAKVAPPRLNGDTVGVLATRSPHRLVPIGMTAAKLIRIENGDTLVLGGIDLIDGTPVLDVKPYVPKYDSIPDAKYPDWIVVENQFKDVIFTDRAKEQLQELSSGLKILKDYEQALSTIRQALILDPRSVYRKQKFEKEAFGFHIDSLNIQCFIEDNVATIYNIEPGDQESDTQPEEVGVARETKQ